MELEFTEQFKRAFRLMEETQKNVFITGRAGTGKSTLLTYFRNNTRKNVVVLAPTGVAALNVSGQTIHSFFGFKPDITPERVQKVKGEYSDIYKKIDAIIIDEVSMVRADLFACIDRFMRKNGKKKKSPFGGVQIILIGDLYQLPPVVKSEEKKLFRTIYNSQYFFDTDAFREANFDFVELEKIYRQHDETFITILNAIRNNTITDEQISLLNSRVNPDFEPEPDDFYIYLTTTNNLSKEINLKQLEKLSGKTFQYTASVRGDIDLNSLPGEFELQFKKGAQVMLVNNDTYGRWVNGSIGKVKDIYGGEDCDIVEIELTTGERVEVTPYTWRLFRFYYDEDSQKVLSETIGSYTQYPFILSWGITIHKSQGKTFDKVIIDIGKGSFACGQIYVALSRCRTLEGIILKRPLRKRDIFVDWRVVKFITEFQYNIAEKRLPIEEKIRILSDAMKKRIELKITYLKASDEKSERIIKPTYIGEMEFAGKTFLGVRAIDSLRNEERTFRIDRILELSKI